MTDRRLALVVAVDSYDHDALHGLAAPAADASALADVLGDPGLGAFEVDILHNPTSWAACEQVEQLLADRHPTDLVLLHFSCHGLKDDSGELYLAARNTRPDRLGSTAVDSAWVSRLMQRSRAQRVILLLDCCYGGAFERGVLPRAAGPVDVGDQFRQSGRGRVVITASTAMEYSFEGAQLAGGDPAPSVFTGALVEGIRTGDADRDQDGHVALSELYDYVYDRVREQTPYQTPSKWEFGLRGDLYVARNPHARRPRAPSPPEEAPPENAEELPENAEVPVGNEEEPEGADRPNGSAENILAGHILATGWSDPEPQGRRLGTRSLVLSGAAVLLLVAAVVAGLILWNQHSGNGNGNGNGNGAAGAAPTGSGESSSGRGYQDLLAMLPADVRVACTPEPTPPPDSSAEAQCHDGVFTVWNSQAAVDKELGLAGAVAGGCTDRPAGAQRRRAPLPASGRHGTVVCNLLNSEQPPSAQLYRVEWGISDLRLTGGFFSAAGGDRYSYEPTYERAMTVLGQIKT
jgi:caspase domain-containing protein